ncbi:sacsin N-terminal ATP-binding-like domain-containing protein [Tomitella biformata]|uniref:sacsin N-terminal ATP-binding-like domain-containing protein n=1 Tax=Tomitella biformata TaxID=630403 RepID=UPI0004B8C2FE|nr:ATP-binding protein [Tomitella biformata]
MGALRTATLDSWRASPTRLREDAATEADLRHGGYRDRVLTELAQNAADAASAAGIVGALAVWLTAADSGAQQLHISNTGAPLDSAGVEALCALRASSKTGGVGRFGVGFTSVSMISEDIDLRSTSGAVRFSGARTRELLAQSGIAEPEVGVPVLRLAWAIDAPPVAGADTEVVLTLRPDIDARALMEQMAGEAVDLLLELTGLGVITVDGVSWTRTRTELSAEPGPDILAQIAIGDRTWLEAGRGGVRWLARMDGDRVVPAGPDVLRAPTRSDEELSLPAILVADVPMAPDRRRLLPTGTIDHVAHGYPALVRAVPAAQRLALVPTPGFARSAADAEVRASIIAALRDHDWLPTVRGVDVSAAKAVLLPNLTAELAEVLADTVDALVVPELSGPSGAVALAAVDVTILDPGGLAQLLSGMVREPGWWRQLYDALEPLAADSLVAEQLSSLPVPLADGRVVTGPRTVVVGVDVEGGLALPWVRLVHPEAAHPLLTRLGAGEVTALELLRDPELETAVEAAADDDGFEDGELTPEQLADTVLTLAALAPEGSELPSWLGAVLLPDGDGELRSADELLLAGAPLAQVLAEESPFGLVDEEFRARHSDSALRAIGVGWSFTLLRVEAPTGPDHDLDDEDFWWDGLDEEPDTLIAVRDLDLIHPDRWPAALGMLAGDPQIGPLLADRDGYTAWWLRRHAVVDGQRLGLYRGEDETFSGLLDKIEIDDVSAYAGLLAGAAVESAELAETLLARLGDPDRTPSAAVTATAHRLLAEALRRGVIDTEDLDAPARVRALDGSVVDAERAMVLDKAWLAAVVPPSRLVLGLLAAAVELAELLDIDLASDVVHADVVSTGRASAADQEPGAVLAAAQRGLSAPTGQIHVHRELRVRLGDDSGEMTVPWWVDDGGRMHTDERWTGPLDTTPPWSSSRPQRS